MTDHKQAKRPGQNDICPLTEIANCHLTPYSGSSHCCHCPSLIHFLFTLIQSDIIPQILMRDPQLETLLRERAFEITEGRSIYISVPRAEEVIGINPKKSSE